MADEYEVVWDGRELTEGLDRDYADMKGDGWDLIWQPTSPLTTPWLEFAHMAKHSDPDRYITTALSKPTPRRKRRAETIHKDWTREYLGRIAQSGKGR